MSFLQLPQSVIYEKNFKYRSKVIQKKKNTLFLINPQQLSDLNSLQEFKFFVKDYFDPYSLHMKVTIEVDQDQFPYTEFVEIDGLVLDGSSQSLISELKIYSNERLVEHIEQYDEVTCLLETLYQNQFSRQQKQYQGLFYNKPPNIFECTNLTHSYNNNVLIKPNSIIFDQMDGIQLIEGQKEGTVNYGYIRGYIKPFGSDFKTFDIIQPHIPISTMKDGRYLTDAFQLDGLWSNNKKQYTSPRRTYYIPIYSGVIGQLIPHDQYKYIPGRLLGELSLKFQFNTFAFFRTTPHKQSAKYKVIQCELIYDTFKFSKEIKYEADTIEKIQIVSESFTKGLECRISQESQINQYYNFSTGLTSLKQFYFFFSSGMYRKDQVFRKHQKCNLGIQSYQLRLKQRYIPIQKLEIANNSVIFNDQKNDNTYQLLELLKSADLMNNQFINPELQKNAMIIPESENLEIYNNQLSSNPEYLFNYQRQGSSCIYTIDTQFNNFDSDTINGLNTFQERPFELIINGKMPTNFNIDHILFAFLHHHIFVNYNTNGITVIK